MPNGLRVVVVRDPHAAEVQVTMRYAVGSADDPPDHPGMAHLVEHLMFQQVLGSQTLFAHLDAIATFRNAFTTQDATTYVTRALTAQLDKLFEIEAARMQWRCTTVTDSVFVRERAVVADELHLHDDVRELLADLYRAVYPANHPYRLDATADSTSAITRAQACAFADAHYAPNNAVLVVSGNVTQDQIVAATSQTFAKIARHDVAARVAVAPVKAALRQLDAPISLDREAGLITWPIAGDPDTVWQIGMVAPMLAAAIEQQVKGSVVPVMLGDNRAAVFGLFILPGEKETAAVALEHARGGIVTLPSVFTDATTPAAQWGFEALRQTAIYQLFSTLEDGSARDTRLATYMHSGRDPAQALAREFAGVRGLDRQAAFSIALRYLGLAQATFLVLHPKDAKKRGHDVTPTKPVHDLGQLREQVDPALAHQFAPGRIALHGLDAMRTRTLPNGLRVVLLPLTSMPTVDIRLVFGAGTADEPANKRGAALAAGHALQWDPTYANDWLLFVRSGGSQSVEVGKDRTSFAVRGLDMHIDLLLAGLRRWVRDGTYYFSAEDAAQFIRYERKLASDEDAYSDAWKVALYGPDHPYVHAGLIRHASGSLNAGDAQAFRVAHFAPDGATLVVAGHFDAELVDRWIDFLFADWTGHAQPRESPAPAPSPASLVKIEDLSQVNLTIVLPVAVADRAQRLIAAEMLNTIAWDVRHQLGASYTFEATLDEQRLSASYVISGWIEASRCTEAVELVRDRIAKLRSDPDAAARAFVSARARVITQLIGITASAASLASHVEHDVEMARPPMADVKTAGAAQTITIESMGPALAELDLSRAAIFMRGPRAETERAFKVLGRAPTEAHLDRNALAAEEAPATATANAPVVDHIEPPITAQPEPSEFAFRLGLGYSFASISSDDPDYHLSGTSGPAIIGDVSDRMAKHLTVGLHVSAATLGGHYTRKPATEEAPISQLAFDVDGTLEVHGWNRLWAGILLGVHVDQVMLQFSEWSFGVGGGLEAGFDLYRRGNHHLSLVGSFTGTVITDTQYAGLTLGLQYRH